MANDLKYYLRFDDRRFAGQSKYRPSEGWIDLVSKTTPEKRRGDVTVKCGRDRVIPLLVQATVDGRNVGTAELEVRLADAWWMRFKMTDVIISGATHSSSKPSEFTFTLNYSDRTISPGMKPPGP
jgi:type VI protein secretion system component Hcp